MLFIYTHNEDMNTSHQSRKPYMFCVRRQMQYVKDNSESIAFYILNKNSGFLVSGQKIRDSSFVDEILRMNFKLFQVRTTARLPRGGHRNPAAKQSDGLRRRLVSHVVRPVQTQFRTRFDPQRPGRAPSPRPNQNHRKLHAEIQL